MEADSADNFFAAIRTRAASDPKAARSMFLSIYEGDPARLDRFLTLATRPGEGRLRQMVATVFRTVPTAVALEAWLRRWQEIESDEFTRVAINVALASRNQVPQAKALSRTALPQLAESYRYVSDRLCHRIRNAMSLPAARIRQLERLGATTSDPETRREIGDILAGLQTGFRRMSRIVEFDSGDDYLEWQSIAFVPWLESISSGFAARIGNLQLSLTSDAQVRRIQVRATPFHLETIFGNLWANALQAVEPAQCLLEVRCAFDRVASKLVITVVDNGPGFPQSQLDSAFTQLFSTKGAARGRGLLEVADAVIRLQGEVDLVSLGDGGLRVQVKLPAVP